jgi:membrane dipeptidase
MTQVTGSWPVTAEAAELHRRAFVWDNIFPFFDFYAFSLTMSGAQAGSFDPKYDALECYATGGCDAVGLTIAGSGTDVALTMKLVATNRAYFRSRSERFVLAESVHDLAAAKASGRTAVVLGFQGSDSLGGNVDMVEVYYKLGVRSMLLAYNTRSSAGSGCHERSDDGLSNFGVEVVRQMNRVGMLVDGSHTGHRTVMDLFEHSDAPVVFTHSNPAALQPHPRNIPDEQIDACAASGGVIGVVGFDGFLPGGTASAESVLRAVDYLVQRVGPQHVGLGLDWVYCEDMFRHVLDANTVAYPAGESGGYRTGGKFFSPADLPLLTQGMLQLGYPARDVLDILGGNWLRVATRVWK